MFVLNPSNKTSVASSIATSNTLSKLEEVIVWRVVVRRFVNIVAVEGEVRGEKGSGRLFWARRWWRVSDVGGKRAERKL
jgi:hypothetical protein